VLKKLFGSRLKQLRKERKITQEKFAEAIGIKDSRTIRSWEKGITGPDSLDRIEKIAQVLEVEAWELLCPHEIKKEPAS
jgi:transcriptional regulator with XRE-family HTH domain